MSNAGGVNQPWSTLADVFKVGKTFDKGDVLVLHRGYHGAPTITGIHSGNVFIRPKKGHTPAVRFLILQNAHYWHIKGLTISKSTTPKDHPDHTLNGSGLKIDDQKNENSHFNIIESCSLYTRQDSNGFTAMQWKNNKAGIAVYGKNNQLTGNHLFNGGGIQIGYHSNNTYVGHNVVENIASDAMGIRGNNCVIEHNLLMNSHKVDGNHNDLIQGWGSKGNIIRHNQLWAFTDPNQKFISNGKKVPKGISTTQGIGCFDGKFEGWVIENNLIRVDHPIGIMIINAQGCTIRGNKVFRAGKKLWLKHKRRNPPGICIGFKNRGAGSRNNVIVDNEAEYFSLNKLGKKKFPVGRMENNVVSHEYNPPVNTSPPSRPHDVKTVPVQNLGVDLSWKASTDDQKVSGYMIYRNNTWIGKTRTGTNFLAIGYQDGRFAVQAFDAHGNYSKMSVESSP